MHLLLVCLNFRYLVVYEAEAGFWSLCSIGIEGFLVLEFGYLLKGDSYRQTKLDFIALTSLLVFWASGI